ncbi:MAG: hypothetical protein WEB37_00270 [Bacteroidota bacterium]
MSIRREKRTPTGNREKSRTPPHGTNARNPLFGRVPTGWSVKKFSDVFRFLGSEPIPRDLLTKAGEGSQTYCIHYGDIHAKYTKEILDFEVESQQVPVLRSNDVLSQKPDYLMNGDLVIADASEDYQGIAEAVELRNLKGRRVVGGLHTITARDTGGDTLPGYRTYALRHPAVRKRIMRAANGLSVFGISKSNLSKIDILLPPR